MSWIHVLDKDGKEITGATPSGNTQIQISADTNPNPTLYRNATIVFKAGNMTRTLKVHQGTSVNPTVSISGPSSILFSKIEEYTITFNTKGYSEILYYTVSAKDSSGNDVSSILSSTGGTIPEGSTSVVTKTTNVTNDKAGGLNGVTINVVLKTSNNTVLSSASCVVDLKKQVTLTVIPSELQEVTNTSPRNITYTVSSSDSVWTASTSDNWITLSKLSGSEGESFTASFTAREAPETTRTGHITITNETSSTTLDISQTKEDVVITKLYLVVESGDPDSIKLSTSKTAVESINAPFKIDITNIEAENESYPYQYTASDTIIYVGTYTSSLAWSPCKPYNITDFGGRISATVTSGYELDKTNIYIIEGSEPTSVLTITPGDKFIDYPATSITYTIEKSDSPVTASTKDYFLQISGATTGVEGDQIVITVDENEYNATRVGTGITFTNNTTSVIRKITQYGSTQTYVYGVIKPEEPTKVYLSTNANTIQEISVPKEIIIEDVMVGGDGRKYFGSAYIGENYTSGTITYEDEEIPTSVDSASGTLGWYDQKASGYTLKTLDIETKK